MQRRAARFVKKNIASLLELSRKFWIIWNGQHSRKEGKLHDSQRCLKLSLVISYTEFHPVYDLKGDGALGNSFKLMSKQTNSKKFYCTYNQRLEIFAKLCHWKAASGVFQNGRREPSLKTLNRELFIITIFIHLTFAPWLYLNTSTCTIAHPPWWNIPFADNMKRIRIRITEGLPFLTKTLF